MGYLLVNVLLTTPTLTFPISDNLFVHHRLILMWMLMGTFDSEPIAYLAVSAQSKRGFDTEFSLPDTRDVLEARNTMELDHKERVNRAFLK